MKVGDYVRTKREIIKVSRIYERADGNMVFDDEKGLQWYFTGIKKTSPNIIDLIEVGDYVNGKLVSGFDYQHTKDVQALLVNYSPSSGQERLKKEDIKSIVTKEMYSSVEYRVESN